MSRAHYEQELHNTMEAKKSKTKGQTCPPVDAKCLLQFPFSENPFYFLTEESILSVSVGDEKLPHMTQESHIEVCHDPHTTRICVFCAAQTPLNVHVLAGPALSPSHIWHDRERAGANRGAHRGEGGPVIWTEEFGHKRSSSQG